MLPADQMKRGSPHIAAGLKFLANYFLTILNSISHEVRCGFEMQQPITIGENQQSRGGLDSGQSSTLLSV